MAVWWGLTVKKERERERVDETWTRWDLKRPEFSNSIATLKFRCCMVLILQSRESKASVVSSVSLPRQPVPQDLRRDCFFVRMDPPSCAEGETKGTKRGKLQACSFSDDIFRPECFSSLFLFLVRGMLLCWVRRWDTLMHLWCPWIIEFQPLRLPPTIISWRGVALSTGTFGTTNCCLGSGLDGGHWDMQKLSIKMTTASSAIFHWTIWSIIKGSDGKFV